MLLKLSQFDECKPQLFVDAGQNGKLDGITVDDNTLVHDRAKQLAGCASGAFVGSLRAGIDLENRTQIMASLTEDSQEAMQSFLHRRQVNWSNR